MQKSSRVTGNGRTARVALADTCVRGAKRVGLRGAGRPRTVAARNVARKVDCGVSTSPAAPALDSDKETEMQPGLFEGFWQWNGYRIRYQRSGDVGPAVVLIHGFGGNCDHWRKNTPELGKSCRVFSLDLLGYGYSDKPDPRSQPHGELYCFDTWANQTVAFIDQVVKEPSFLICNSIGGMVGLQAGLNSPDVICGVQLLNISLRMLHVKNQPTFARPFIKAFQDTLYNTPAGEYFFNQVAQPRTVKNILQQAYCDGETVTDELVEKILQPGLEPGASAVFLAFICYSGGPLPRELIPKMNVPVSILWGKEDPWEKVEWGREFKQYSSVEEFVELPGIGHCPQDEAPQVVNPLIERFVFRHSQN